MTSKTKQNAPEIVLRDGKPVSVIIDIAEYKEMLERLEDAEDLKKLEKLRGKTLKFRKLEDFLSDHGKRA